MIIYHEELSPKFSEYGINIPIHDDRSRKVYEHLLGKFGPGIFFSDLKKIPVLTREDLLLAHTSQYVQDLFSKRLFDRIVDCYEICLDVEKPFPPGKKGMDLFLENVLRQSGAAYLAMKMSLQNGFSYFLGGGMHHAMSFKGRGFCLVNDIVIGIRKLQKEGLIKTAIVVDIDAHKGDGTAEITKDDPSIYTLSIHMKKGWPLHLEDKSGPEFIPSKCDIALDSGEEDQYLLRLGEALPHLPKADLCVVVDGSDPYEKDELLSSQLIKLNLKQMLERNLLVYEFLKGQNIPQAYVMAGGYGLKSWKVYAQFLEKVLA